ncbi:enoyl-CoA hydratase [Deferribacter autotrophicus]|uniref:Enoyl-CoA hydratase n=1 Tax=Deferribacter autotrophicus TaxID=500465 RepID=A0A5A8F2U0_9BACT|nr:enoyl-CoA hydratase-related protein [Deferribacter autotrophicus]KAA0257809.1 enoyl-CoA hydratase [Deferribacter autotrophicus]
MEFKFFKYEKDSAILKVFFNNDENMNALTWDFFKELPEIVNMAENDSSIAAVVFYSLGKHFSIGLDIFNFATNFPDLMNTDIKSKREKLYNLIKEMQIGMNLMENGKNIYIAAVNGYCIGGALDFIAACDLRFASKDAIFSLRETKLGIIADLGSLQRLPYIIGFGNTKYLAYTGMDIDATKAKDIQLLNEVFDSKEELLKKVFNIAKTIADNPKDAVSGSKKFINNLNKHIIERELDAIATHNSSFLDFLDVNNNLQKMLKNRG